MMRRMLGLLQNMVVLNPGVVNLPKGNPSSFENMLRNPKCVVYHPLLPKVNAKKNIRTHSPSGKWPNSVIMTACRVKQFAINSYGVISPNKKKLVKRWYV